MIISRPRTALLDHFVEYREIPKQIAHREAKCYIPRHKLRALWVAAYIGGTCSNRRCAYFAPGIPWEIFIAVSINYILYTTVPPSREPLVWVVDIDFDICTSCSSAIFIARIKRHASFARNYPIFISSLSLILYQWKIWNCKVIRRREPFILTRGNIFINLIKNTRRNTLYMYKCIAKQKRSNYRKKKDNIFSKN